MRATSDDIPDEWKEYFDNLQVMVFSSSKGPPRAVDEDELHRLANLCIRHSHGRLLNDASLVAEVKECLSSSPFMPWGTRLVVQGSLRPVGAGGRIEEDTINEFLCLLRGPQSLGMANHWIGIVCHDETPYMTGRIAWLVRHVRGRGKRRHLLFAKDAFPSTSDTAAREVIWDRQKMDNFNELIY